ncbi:glucose-1-phosphate cytidylyltransferase [Actinomycetospora sp. NBRC 106375]|uniref:glucose-1-phosphate cytidylyltransferase n=1 Tax=Actinomycetospora sp. NBRC 106375 TaxID=3032207 RepID=UPI0024A5E83F|nr:glucose-1-phosphate cytidylyltransferase [Actinomycetospora sp. NBRC 106375]GLZ48523.1 glucose-1-phosphate cytidylyltransferase [Actinomycetospora sp. NBRC 106375]
MKVVLFCGGFGMRMRDGDSDVPKPMQMVGPRPLIWHVMRYYAHFGHKEFILCLGYGAHHIKDYFLDYRETESNDFVLREGELELQSSDIADWTIHFVHTGLESPIGERLRRVRHLVEGEEMFLANYADVLTDAPLDAMVDKFRASDATASLLAVPPQAVFHIVDVDGSDRVNSIYPVTDMHIRENGGYFVLRPEVIDYIPENGDLVGDAGMTLAKEGKLLSYPWEGFWQPADTLKERNALEASYRAGTRPWMVWEKAARAIDRPPLESLVAQELSERDTS